MGYVGYHVLLIALLTLTTAVLAPVVALATVVLLPFADRPTQLMMMGAWTSYVSLAGVALL